MKEHPYHKGITDGSLVEDFDRETSSENLSPSYKLGYRDGYNKGIADGNINDGTFAQKVKEAYENGLNDAWECVRKITEDKPMAEWVTLCDFFGVKRNDFFEIFKKYSVSEVIERMEKYDGKTEIEVGDEVYYDCSPDDTMIVLRKTKDLTDGGYSFDGLYKDGTVKHDGTLKLVKRTGRHFDGVKKLLEQMRGNA